MTTSIATLQNAWAKHPRFQRRALGGKWALDGFHYQFAVSLKFFFQHVLARRVSQAELAFEGLSDISSEGELTYLIQVKTTLDPRSYLAAIKEALAVDEFLEEAFEELREMVSYQITTRRIRGSVPSVQAGIAGEGIGLPPEQWARWETLRGRCLPPTVSAAPGVDLAITLRQDVTRPFSLIDECMGRLLDMIPAGKSSVQIAEELLRIWEQYRIKAEAPLHLLGAADFQVSVRGSNIVHGVRPSPTDLRDGCFMERPDRIEAALAVVRGAWSEVVDAREPVVPIIWVTGPTGAGKSVLLLQMAQELVGTGEIEAVNFISTNASTLPRSLEHAAGTSVPLIVLGDDLYSPDDNRDPAIWRKTGELAATLRFSPRFAIFTCGPIEQLRAFKRECHRHPALSLIEIAISPLQEEERSRYHTWYQQRTGSAVPEIKEDIFVAAAWTYELYREERLTPEAFAYRFDERLRELGMQAPGHAALGLNLYGLKAPESLFAAFRPELAELVSERVWRLAHPGTMTLAGRFFHPQICRLIYDVIVPVEYSVRRASDIAYGFGSMLDEGEPADAFLGWLGSGKLGKKSRPRGALLLDETMRVEILRALWPTFDARGPRLEVIPRLMRWHYAAREAGVDHRLTGIRGRIRDWWRASLEAEPQWPLLFQLVWDDAETTERHPLVERGKKWLETYCDDDERSHAWSFVWRRLVQFRMDDGDLGALGHLWLERFSNHPGWPRVWADLQVAVESRQDSSLISEREELALQLHSSDQVRFPS